MDELFGILAQIPRGKFFFKVLQLSISCNVAVQSCSNVAVPQLCFTIQVEKIDNLLVASEIILLVVIFCIREHFQLFELFFYEFNDLKIEKLERKDFCEAQIESETYFSEHLSLDHLFLGGQSFLLLLLVAEEDCTHVLSREARREWRVATPENSEEFLV